MTQDSTELTEHNKQKMRDQYTRQDQVLEIIHDEHRCQPAMVYKNHPIAESRCYTAFHRLRERGWIQTVPGSSGMHELTEAGLDRIEEIRQRDDLQPTFTEGGEVDVDPSEFRFTAGDTDAE